MTWAVSDYISRVRQKIDDTNISNRLEEDITDLIVGGNGVATQFLLSKTLILSSPAPMANINETGYTSTGLTVANGIATFNTAPPLSSTYPTPTSGRILYYWQHFTDSVNWPSATNYDIDQFVNEGLQKLNYPTLTQGTAYVNLTNREFDVVCLYGAYFGAMELANRYARQVDQNAEGTSSTKSKISVNYQNLAKELYDQAEKERLAIYGPRQGQSTVAGIAFGRTLPTSAFWTPKN